MHCICTDDSYICKFSVLLQVELMAVELLRREANPNRESGHSGPTPLHLAVTLNKVELVKMLLMKGAHLEAVDDYGYTPLLKAVKYSVPDEIIDLLLVHGADVYAVTEDEKTALHFAAQNDEEDMIRAMIERGLPVDVEDNDGWTPLHEAVYYGSGGAAKALIEQGDELLVPLQVMVHTGTQPAYSLDPN